MHPTTAMPSVPDTRARARQITHRDPLLLVCRSAMPRSRAADEAMARRMNREPVDACETLGLPVPDDGSDICGLARASMARADVTRTAGLDGHTFYLFTADLDLRPHDLTVVAVMAMGSAFKRDDVTLAQPWAEHLSAEFAMCARR